MPTSVFDRFLSLREVMEAQRKWYEGRYLPDRLAAVMSVCEDSAGAVADMNAAEAAIKAQCGPFSPLRANYVRCFAAALLAAQGRDAPSFISAWRAGRTRLREAGLPRGGDGEVFTILLHFLRSGGQTLSAEEARALHEAWRTLKAARWWIAGSSHYPFLALGLGGDAGQHAERALAVYKGMKARKLSGGSLRLAAALAVAPAEGDPDAVAARYRQMHDAFAAEGLPTGGSRYGTLASLCRLEGEPQTLARAVAGLTSELRALRPRPQAPDSLAALLLLHEHAESLTGSMVAVGEALALIAAQTAAIMAGAVVAGGAAASGS